MKEIIDGLQIIMKYDGNSDFAAEHDRIWAGIDYGKAVTEMSDEDLVTMKANGWFIDDEFNCWTHFA